MTGQLIDERIYLAYGSSGIIIVQSDRVEVAGGRQLKLTFQLKSSHLMPQTESRERHIFETHPLPPQSTNDKHSTVRPHLLDLSKQHQLSTTYSDA